MSQIAVPLAAGWIEVHEEGRPQLLNVSTLSHLRTVKKVGGKSYTRVSFISTGYIDIDEPYEAVAAKILNATT